MTAERMIGGAGNDLLRRVKLELRTPHGRLRFDNDNLADCVRRYRHWFGLDDGAPLTGTVHRFQLDGFAEEIGPPASLEVELASAAELAAKESMGGVAPRETR